MQSKSYSIDIGGKTMTAEFTDLAENASGSCLLRYGNTTVLATAVMSEKTRDDIDYFPLTVDYEERFYAAGAILGSRFMRREGRPSEEAILSGRIVDRTIRPLFPGHIRNEVQVIITVLSLDEDDPAQVAVNAASLALATSDIPWNGPVAAVRIGLISQGDAFVINPTYEQRDRASLDTLACGKDTTINMVEVAAKEADEKTIAAAFESAVAEHSKLLAWQEDIIAEVGKQKRPAPEPELSTALTELFKAEFAPRLGETVFCGEAGKKNIYALKKEWLEKAGALETQGSTSDQGSSRSNLKIADRYFEDKIDEEIHRGAIEEGKRADGRGMGEIRRLFAKAGGISPVLHGSGIFYRGGTHVFTALTLGGPGDSLLVDTMESQEEKRRFMHHYNFPPYSGGETGRMGGINRRAIGHGALAQKALEPVLPSQEQFPYTIRLVSECFASNGSTSMGSACASTLALMDGGVPIKAPVAGIAMGLMMRGANVYKILTDIQGPEDSHGDMDFKVAGTRGGVTAIQMDIKLGGVPVPILTEALEGARAARMQILDLMEKEIPAPRAKLSPRAPEIISMRVRPDQIGLVIGGGGKTINGIRDSARLGETH